MNLFKLLFFKRINKIERLNNINKIMEFYLKQIKFPLELILTYHCVIAGGCLRCIDVGLPIRDIDVFVRRKDFKEGTFSSLLNYYGFKKLIINNEIKYNESIVKFSKGDIIIDIKIIEDKYTLPVFKLMDLTNCMISYGENGILKTTADNKYFKSIEEFSLDYNTDAIPYYKGTEERLEKFKLSGWNVSKAVSYIADHKIKERDERYNSDKWCGS